MFNTCIVAPLEGFRRNSPVFPYESIEYAYFPYSLSVCQIYPLFKNKGVGSRSMTYAHSIATYNTETAYQGRYRKYPNTPENIQNTPESIQNTRALVIAIDRALILYTGSA